LTAMHCVVFRISKGEELAVTKVFFMRSRTTSKSQH
jgi:hypothetical protein